LEQTEEKDIMASSKKYEFLRKRHKSPA
jgi:hypothetical protein